MRTEDALRVHTRAVVSTKENARNKLQDLVGVTLSTRACDETLVFAFN